LGGGAGTWNEERMALRQESELNASQYSCWAIGMDWIIDMIMVRSEDQNYISVLAMEKKLTVGFPFVEANLIRKSDADELILPAKIPSSLISGIFDLTRKETESKFGFVGPKKKS